MIAKEKWLHIIKFICCVKLWCRIVNYYHPFRIKRDLLAYPPYFLSPFKRNITPCFFLVAVFFSNETYRMVTCSYDRNNSVVYWWKHQMTWNCIYGGFPRRIFKPRDEVPCKQGAKNKQFSYLLQNDNSSLIAKKSILYIEKLLRSSLQWNEMNLADAFKTRRIYYTWR